MSVILPRRYKEIADELGSAYAKVRDSLFADGVDLSDSIVPNVLNVSTAQDANADDNYLGSGTPDDGVRTEIDGGAPTPAVPPGTESDDPNNANFSNWLNTSPTKITAPEGSIAQDMGTPLFNLVNTTASEANAKSTSANLFATYLRAMNNHVVNRTFGVSNINGYYQTYAYISGQQDMSLFDSDPSTPGILDGPSYFSAEFCELSAQLGITIDATYCP